MSEKSLEAAETITYNEFRAWMTGLIRGKRGAIPDLEDWKQIKIMMDKVKQEVKIETVPSQERPYFPESNINPYPNMPISPPAIIWPKDTDNFGIPPNIYSTSSGTSTTSASEEIKISSIAETAQAIDNEKFHYSTNNLAVNRTLPPFPSMDFNEEETVKELNVALDEMLNSINCTKYKK